MARLAAIVTCHHHPPKHPLMPLQGDLELMKKLINQANAAAHALVNSKNSYGMTPLHFAVMRHHISMIAVLVGLCQVSAPGPTP